jgi:hypothetical protein
MYATYSSKTASLRKSTKRILLLLFRCCLKFKFFSKKMDFKKGGAR